MSGAHPEFEWLTAARDELNNQGDRVFHLLERLAQDAAVDAPFAPGLEFIVQREHVLTAVRQLLGEDVQPPGSIADRSFAFISYSSGDVDFVRELCTDLEQAGIACFRDERSIRTGARWVDELHDAVRRCRVFVMVVTPRVLNSDWCKIEAGAAWGLDKPIFAILRYVTPVELPGPLNTLQARTVETRQQQVELIDELKAYFVADE